ncbi:MAG: RsmG family class I SAM-dependent methyltransferase, partial [Candidatus Eisenbacteria bacterium]
AAVDLVSRGDRAQLPAKHVAASLGALLVEQPQAGSRWIDVGTGGGFPGMVLKICRPDARITLLDSSEKKTAFLERIGRRLQLPDFEVIRGRVEELTRGSKRAIGACAGDDATLEGGPSSEIRVCSEGGVPLEGGVFSENCVSAEGATPTDGRGTAEGSSFLIPPKGYDVILMRAVARLSESLRLVDSISASRARLLIYKGPAWDEELKEAAESRNRLGWQFLDLHPIPWAKSRILRLSKQCRG